MRNAAGQSRRERGREGGRVRAGSRLYKDDLRFFSWHTIQQEAELVADRLAPFLWYLEASPCVSHAGPVVAFILVRENR